MQFITKIETEKLPWQINYNSKILLLGSCFSSNIGGRLCELKFNVCENPFGVIYNPQSIANSITMLLENKQVCENDLHKNNDLWYNFSYHTSFSDIDKQNALNKMNEAKKNGADFIKTSDFIIITLGSAYTYTNKKSGNVVANCHKISASEFEKKRMNVLEITNVLSSCINKVKAVNPNVKFIFTVSPIRHLSDGAHNNQVSKSLLHITVDEICKSQKNCGYFPAYEIMNDELRDYRFYAEDMVHPSKVAVDYIYMRFANAAIDEKTLKIASRIEQIILAKNHKPFNPESEEHKKFLSIFYKKVLEIKNKYPHIDLTEELKYFANS